MGTEMIGMAATVLFATILCLAGLLSLKYGDEGTRGMRGLWE